VPDSAAYAARLDIDYPESLDRMSTFLRLFLALPILVIIGLIGGAGETVVNSETMNQAGDIISRSRDASGGIAFNLALATALMIAFRQRYPRWWFDFQLELARFGNRVGAYMGLLTDQYPSTVEEQTVHLEVDYPDVATLNRWLPLVKWLLAIPHYVALALLSVLALFAVILAWFAILFTGRRRRTPHYAAMRIDSWNVNGLRACAKKGFCDWLHASDADIVGVQEVRARDGCRRSSRRPRGIYAAAKELPDPGIRHPPPGAPGSTGRSSRDRA